MGEVEERSFDLFGDPESFARASGIAVGLLKAIAGEKVAAKVRDRRVKVGMEDEFLRQDSLYWLVPFTSVSAERVSPRRLFSAGLLLQLLWASRQVSGLHAFYPNRFSAAVWKWAAEC